MLLLLRAGNSHHRHLLPMMAAGLQQLLLQLLLLLLLHLLLHLPRLLAVGSRVSRVFSAALLTRAALLSLIQFAARLPVPLFRRWPLLLAENQLGRRQAHPPYHMAATDSTAARAVGICVLQEQMEGYGKAKISCASTS